jgi:hypothetical protein
VVSGEALAELELVLAAAAVLALVAISGKQERVCNLTAEAAWHVDESD